MYTKTQVTGVQVEGLRAEEGPADRRARGQDQRKVGEKEKQEKSMH